MTEQEWLTSENPIRMLDAVVAKASKRKLLLYGVECCCIVWRNRGLGDYGPALECIVQMADGADNLREVREKWAGEGHQLGSPEDPQARCWNMIYVSARVGDESLPTEATAALLRELFGNPFRPVSFDSAWQTPTVLALATAAYESRILPAGTLDPARLAVLADALEDVGCHDADMLNHCRQPGVHVRGCWVLDLLLGKDWHGSKQALFR